MAKAPKSKTEYRFKVALKDDKGIWRTIALRGDQSLDHLHAAIFAAFDRFEEHLYSFYFPKAPRGRPGFEPIREYTSSFMLEDPGPFETGPRFDASRTRLDDLELAVGERFEYLFDFGDCWMHELRVERIQPVSPDKRYPHVVSRKGGSPPQYPDPE